MGLGVAIAEGCPRAAAGGQRDAGDRHAVAFSWRLSLLAFLIKSASPFRLAFVESAYQG
jgi:hypothetical protein